MVFPPSVSASASISTFASSTFSNNISSETAGPIETKLHVEPPRGGETKVCSECLGHMTKMAVMPIYGKNF